MRIKAVLASMPMAAPVDVTTLSRPSVAAGLIAAGSDQALPPAAQVRSVQAACTTCTMVLDLAVAGHGSLFSLWPADLAKSLTPLLVDPPGFNRGDLPALYEKMVAFCDSQL